MKMIMKAKRTVAVAMVLLGLFVGRDALAFYNPQTGRWLNRDPIGERGGANQQAFAGNSPVSRCDADGRMVLQEIARELPSPPINGPYVTYGGLTWFEKFEPKARVHQGREGPCCWKIDLPGYAHLYYWWVRGGSGPGGAGTARDHEMVHVALHRDAYQGFNCEASSYVGVCYSKRKAECLRSVINGEMKEATLSYNHLQNLELDCRTLGQRCDEIPQVNHDAAASRSRVTSALEACERME